MYNVKINYERRTIIKNIAQRNCPRPSGDDGNSKLCLRGGERRGEILNAGKTERKTIKKKGGWLSEPPRERLAADGPRLDRIIIATSKCERKEKGIMPKERRRKERKILSYKEAVQIEQSEG